MMPAKMLLMLLLKLPSILILMLSMLAMSSVRAAPVIRLGFSDVETYPYQMGNGLNLAEPPGLAVELIRQVALELKIQLVFQRLPNRRVMVALKNGEIDGAFIFSHNPEREQFSRYPMQQGKLDSSRRIARLAYYFYTLPGSKLQWDGTKLTGLQGTIGANTGYSIVADLSKMAIPVEEAKNTEQNFEKLRIGRLAAVAAQEDMTDPYLSKLANLKVEKLPRPIVAKDYFLVFSHRFSDKNSTLVEKFWDRLGEIREQKSQELLLKYPLP